MSAAAMLIGLSSCGPPLGTYQFENARLVDTESMGRVEPGLSIDPQIANLLRIEFSSADDLGRASDNGDLHVHADFCPFTERYRIEVLGPYYDDHSRYASLQAAPQRQPDGRVIEVVDIQYRRPVLNPRTHRYTYTAYIIPSAPTRPDVAGNAREGYDLRAGVRDLCLRIDHPGYYLTRSQSEVFTIPGAAIAAALRAGTVS